MRVAVAILGGGLSGWALQAALQAQGLPAEQILLIEQHLNGSGSSGVLQGMMHPFTGRSLFPRPGYLAAWRFSRQWFAGLQTQSAQAIYTEMPLWRLAFTPAARQQFERSFARAQEEISDYPLQPAQAPDALATGAVCAAYGMSPALRVDVPQVLAHLADRSAVHRQLRTPVLELIQQQEHWDIKTPDNIWRAERLVFACGHALKAFFPALPLSCKRGEVAVLQSPQPLPGMLSGGGVYIAPLGPGRLITGATFYHAERPWSPQQSWRQLQERLHWLPAAQSAQPLQIWSGIRAVVQPDREALLGRIPGLARAWVMAGFGTRGLLQIPLAAEELAAQILTGSAVAEHLRADRLQPVVWRFNPRPDPG